MNSNPPFHGIFYHSASASDYFISVLLEEFFPNFLHVRNLEHTLRSFV